jgi:hypothetical protein
VNQPARGKDEWRVGVDVHLERGGDNPEFSVHSTLPKNSKGYLKFDNRRPGFIINFNLFDETNSGYVFHTDEKEGVWSLRGDNCPTSPADEVFEPLRVINDGQTLVVRNTNPHPAIGVFKYTLRVTRDFGETFLELDPGGEDLNGPSS